MLSQLFQRNKNNKPAPISMLAKPTNRIVRSSTWASTSTILRHFAGDKKGIIPSNTSSKQTAVPKSFSMMSHPKFGIKKPGLARFLDFNKVAVNVAGVFALIILLATLKNLFATLLV